MQEAQEVRRTIHKPMYALLTTSLALGSSAPAHAHDEPCWEAWINAITTMKAPRHHEDDSQL